MKIRIERLPHAKDIPLPSYITPYSSGVDLRSAIDCTLKKGEIKVIPCGIKIAIPPGYEGQVRARSGLASKGIIVPNAPGTIDADYRGEVKVILANIGEEDFQIKRGDRIAQLVLARVERIEWEEGNLDETERGECGFGHSGLE
ncbi:dUTP diphosphatase [bacterium]|nr:dUTP diphosphatase [bacterium]